MRVNDEWPVNNEEAVEQIAKILSGFIWKEVPAELYQQAIRDAHRVAEIAQFQQKNPDVLSLQEFDKPSIHNLIDNKSHYECESYIEKVGDAWICSAGLMKMSWPSREEALFRLWIFLAEAGKIPR